MADITNPDDAALLQAHINSGLTPEDAAAAVKAGTPVGGQGGALPAGVTRTGNSFAGGSGTPGLAGPPAATQPVVNPSLPSGITRTGSSYSNVPPAGLAAGSPVAPVAPVTAPSAVNPGVASPGLAAGSPTAAPITSAPSTAPSAVAGVAGTAATAAGIPGLTVTEGYPVDGSPEATAARNAANARAGLRASTTPVQDALAAEARAGTSVASKVGTAANGVLNTDVGAAAANGLRAAGGAAKSLVTGTAAKVALPIGAAMGAVQGIQTPTADYYARTGIDPQASVVPQPVKDLGVRALGVMGDVGNNLTGGLADRLGNALSGNGFGHSSAYPAESSGTPGSPAVTNPTGGPSPTPVPAVQNIQPPQAPTASSLTPTDSMNPPGSTPYTPVTRVGNSFSGGNVTEAGMRSANPIGTMPGMDMDAVNRGLESDKQLRLMKMGLQDRGDENYYTTGQGSRGGALAGNWSQSWDPAAKNAQSDREAQMANLQKMATSGRTGAERIAGLTALSHLQATNIEASNQMGMAGMRERGETTRAIAANQTQRNIHADDNEVSLRNNENTNQTALMGHRMTNSLAYANQQREQQNWAAQHALDVQRFGKEVADSNLAANQSASKTTQTQLENTFRTTDDKGQSVPDGAKIASYQAAAQTTLPAMIQALQAAGTPEAAAKARDLNTRGTAALSPQDHADLTQLFNRREQLRTSRSVLPGGAEFHDSSNLLNFRQAPGAAGLQKNALTPNRVRFVGGSSATPNDLTIPGGANAFLPDINKIRTDDLTRGLRTE